MIRSAWKPVYPTCNWDQCLSVGSHRVSDPLPTFRPLYLSVAFLQFVYTYLNPSTERFKSAGKELRVSEKTFSLSEGALGN